MDGKGGGLWPARGQTQLDVGRVGLARVLHHLPLLLDLFPVGADDDVCAVFLRVLELLVVVVFIVIFVQVGIRVAGNGALGRLVVLKKFVLCRYKKFKNVLRVEYLSFFVTVECV